MTVSMLHAQIVDELVIPDSSVFMSHTKLPAKKLQTHVDLNMGYMLSGKGYGGPIMSISPYVSYPVSERMWFNAGISVGYSPYNPFYYYDNSHNQNNMLPMTRMFLFAQGNYRVNERLVVNGTAYKQVFDVPNSNKSLFPATNIDYSGMSVGFNYKITKNISFGAQLQMNSPNRPNYYSPLIQQNSFYNPYSNW